MMRKGYWRLFLTCPGVSENTIGSSIYRKIRWKYGGGAIRLEHRILLGLHYEAWGKSMNDIDTGAIALYPVGPWANFLYIIITFSILFSKIPSAPYPSRYPKSCPMVQSPIFHGEVFISRKMFAPTKSSRRIWTPQGGLFVAWSAMYWPAMGDGVKVFEDAHKWKPIPHRPVLGPIRDSLRQWLFALHIFFFLRPPTFCELLFDQWTRFQLTNPIILRYKMQE